MTSLLPPWLRLEESNSWEIVDVVPFYDYGKIRFSFEGPQSKRTFSSPPPNESPEPEIFS